MSQAAARAGICSRGSRSAEAASAAPSRSVLFVGSAFGIEARVIPTTRFDFRALNIRGLRGRGWRGALGLALQLPAAVAAAWRILGQFRADVVLGVGGYASVPVVAAAWLRRVPRGAARAERASGLRQPRSSAHLRAPRLHDLRRRRRLLSGGQGRRDRQPGAPSSRRRRRRRARGSPCSSSAAARARIASTWRWRTPPRRCFASDSRSARRASDRRRRPRRDRGALRRARRRRRGAGVHRRHGRGVRIAPTWSSAAPARRRSPS